jgi:hypothetical protein
LSSLWFIFLLFFSNWNSYQYFLLNTKLENWFNSIMVIICWSSKHWHHIKAEDVFLKLFRKKLILIDLLVDLKIIITLEKQKIIRRKKTT